MFLSSSIDWFLERRSSHMGPYQYAAHVGMRGDRPTSGAFLWAEAEAARHNNTGNMVNAETALLYKVSEELGHYVPAGINVVELGPGTVTAFKNKTLPIVHKLGSRNCILVDESIMFLKQIAAIDDIKMNFNISPIVDDFFENKDAYLEGQALVCSFGSTISNIINPASPELPRTALVTSLSALAQAANNGWLLVGFDSDQDGEHVKNYFKKHSLFQLNIFDRMAVELPMNGNFRSEAFEYEPEWIEASGQLAHIAVVTRDMNFNLGGTDVSLKQGQKLHIKNSYKFMPSFFEKCCAEAGLEVIKSWADDSPAKIYLLRLLPKHFGTLSSNFYNFDKPRTHATTPIYKAA